MKVYQFLWIAGCLLLIPATMIEDRIVWLAVLFLLVSWIVEHWPEVTRR